MSASTMLAKSFSACWVVRPSSPPSQNPAQSIPFCWEVAICLNQGRNLGRQDEELPLAFLFAHLLFALCDQALQQALSLLAALCPELVCDDSAELVPVLQRRARVVVRTLGGHINGSLAKCTALNRSANAHKP